MTEIIQYHGRQEDLQTWLVKSLTLGETVYPRFITALALKYSLFLYLTYCCLMYLLT
jgi:hypothetical protein